MRLVCEDNPERIEADPMKTYPVLVKAIQELSEFADAYVHLQGGDSSPMDAYVAKCTEVKLGFPK